MMTGGRTKSHSQTRADNERLIAAAVQVAATADEIILIVGDTEQTSREGWADIASGRPR